MTKSNDNPLKRTARLSREALWKLSASHENVTFRPIPYDDTAGIPGPRPVWRVRLDLTPDRKHCLGLDINGPVILGRDESEPDLIDLSQFGMQEGVSRHHMLLRPTPTGDG